MSYDNTNRGSIWKNDKKESENHPDFTGNQNVCCPKCGEKSDFWVSAWRRKDGAPDKAPALSFSVKPKEAPRQAQRQPAPSQGAAPRRRDALDDDAIPFAAEFR